MQEQESNDIEKMFSQALSSFSKKQYDESISHLSKVLLLHPKHQLAYLTRGVAYTKTDRVNLAIEDFGKAIESNPDYDRAYHLRGIAYASLGEHKKAVRDFDKAIALNPQYGAAYLSRANVHAEMGHDEEAQEDMEMVKRLTVKNVQKFGEQNNILEIHPSEA